MLYCFVSSVVGGGRQYHFVLVRFMTSIFSCDESIWILAWYRTYNHIKVIVAFQKAQISLCVCDYGCGVSERYARDVSKAIASVVVSGHIIYYTM